MKKLLAMLLAVMMVLTLTVAVFAEPTDQVSDDEQVDVGDTEEPTETPAPATESNPPTGIALAVVPMMVAVDGSCCCRRSC